VPAFRILLINPNSSTTTTDMMVAIARDTAGDRAIITGATATRAPPSALPRWASLHALPARGRRREHPMR
jgi:Asp/Glu/hydantoin racemase